MRAENIAFPGDIVVDKSLKRVGSVLDLFGPVKKPYIAVKPIKASSEDYTGQILYKLVQDSRRREKTWQKR